MDIESEQVEIKVSGSSEVRLSGNTGQLVFDVSGSGYLNALQLKALVAEIQISGSADCKVHVESSLKANVSGSGRVSYSGNPSKVDTKISGSGNVSKVDV